MATNNNKKIMEWNDGIYPDGITRITELGNEKNENSAYIKLKFKDHKIEIGMVRAGKLNGIDYKLVDLMKIIEDKVRQVEFNTIVLENDVQFPIAGTKGKSKVRGLLLRALQGKPTIYKPYGYKLTNKETHTSNYNNDLSSDLRNTSSISVGIFKSMLDNAIQLINKFSDILEDSNKVINKKILLDIKKMSELLNTKDKDDKLLITIYETFTPELKELLINHILFKFISTKIKLNPPPDGGRQYSEDTFVNLFNDNIKYPKLEEIDNYEIKLNFLKSLHKLYFIQQQNTKQKPVKTLHIDSKNNEESKHNEPVGDEPSCVTGQSSTL